jgi:non-homologous end joining protein Ku
MRGDNALLAVTTTVDEVTGEVKPLFAMPIQVCKATEEQDVKLDVAAPSGAPRQQAWLDTATGEIVNDEDCPRGFRIGDEFRPIDAEAWKAIGATVKERTATMVALGYVDLTPDFWAQHAPRIKGRYFLQSPAKGGVPKAYRLLYEGLRAHREKGKRSLAPARGIVTKRCPRTKQALCLIVPDENAGCLVLLEMFFADALRAPDQAVLAPTVAEVSDDMIEKVRSVVAGLGDGGAALEAEVDEAVALRRELVEKALEGEEIVAPKSKAETSGESALEAQLLASLAAAA